MPKPTTIRKLERFCTLWCEATACSGCPRIGVQKNFRKCHGAHLALENNTLRPQYYFKF